MDVSLTQLWMPIVGSAVVVFFASSLIWMVVQWHNSDYRKLPDEDGARSALKGVAAGQYAVPYAADGKARSDPEWQRKYAEGPAMILTVFPAGPPAMGKQLGLWMVYCLVISWLVAYAGAVVLPAGADYLKVYQVCGTAAVLAYGGGALQGAIWFGHSWGRAFKDLADGVIYGLLTAGMFGWLWPGIPGG